MILPPEGTNEEQTGLLLPNSIIVGPRMMLSPSASPAAHNMSSAASSEQTAGTVATAEKCKSQVTASLYAAAISTAGTTNPRRYQLGSKLNSFFN